MKLFRNKEEKKTCSCGGDCTTKEVKQVAITKNEKSIKVLGSGCAKCSALDKAVHRAIVELGLDYDIQHISDVIQIASYGVMSTPALVIDGKVVSYGKVLTVDKVKKIILNK